MHIVSDLSVLNPGVAYWVPATTAPVRDWQASPGCRRGARFLIDAESFGPGLNHFPAFETRSDCLRWIMAHRTEIERAAPAAPVRAARLDAWMLGLDAV
jgi:hypothetical protein